MKVEGFAHLPAFVATAAKEGTAAERLSIPARRIAINRFILVILSYSPNAICPGR